MDVDLRVVVDVSRLSMVMIVDGGVCLRVLCMGVWYGLWWVWLERCRDGRYAVSASRCDVWVVSV